MQYDERPQNESFKPIPESGKFSAQLYAALRNHSGLEKVSHNTRGN